MVKNLSNIEKELMSELAATGNFNSYLTSLGNNTKLSSTTINGQICDLYNNPDRTYRNKRYASVLDDFGALKALPSSSLEKRWQLKATAEKLLPHERVGHVCMKWIGHNHRNGEIVKTSSGQHSYRKMKLCGSVWHCPLCSSRISEIRRKELSVAIGFSGYKALLATFTLSHHSGDKLEDTLKLIQSAYDLFKSGRWYQSLTKKYRILGTIKALEVTFGENGWHPHIHVLFIVENHDIDHKNMRDTMRKRWLECVEKRGGWCNATNGFTLKNQDTYVQDYVAKFGKMPSKSEWDAVAEITKAIVKKGKRKGFTPFMLLELATRGSKVAGELFQEYARVFKGKIQLRWSNGLKKLMGIEEISDLQAAEAADEAGSLEVVATISPSQWYNIVATKNRANVLIAANELSRQAFLLYLASFEDNYLYRAENNEFRYEQRE